MKRIPYFFKKTHLIVSVVVCFACFTFADEGDLLKERLEGATAKLAKVEMSLTNVQKQMIAKHREMMHFEHDIVYTNGLPAKIYKEIKALERQLVEKRKELQESTMKVPGVRERLAERKELFKQEGVLKDRKLLLENEIKSIEYMMQSKKSKKTVQK